MLYRIKKAIVANKNKYLKTVAILVVLGVPALLFLGFFSDTLSPRKWAIGLLAWYFTLIIWAIVRKLTARKTLESSAEPPIVLDEKTRKRNLRAIWMMKAWIGILAVSLLFGIANGVANRAWLATSVGVVMNLLLTYVALREIKRRRKRLNWSNG
jgi:membrane protease YdiL (CAAX protease family)